MCITCESTDVNDVLLVAHVQVVQEGVFGERRQQHGVALARLRRVGHADAARQPVTVRPSAYHHVPPHRPLPCRLAPLRPLCCYELLRRLIRLWASQHCGHCMGILHKLGFVLLIQ